MALFKVTLLHGELVIKIEITFLTIDFLFPLYYNRIIYIMIGKKSARSVRWREGYPEIAQSIQSFIVSG